MAKLKNPVSETDAAVFDAYVLKWQQLLNLQDWRIERGGRPAKNAMASVEFNPPARLAIYRLGDFGNEAITPESLEQTVIHELLHVVLFDLIDVASGKSTEDEVEAAEHKVINVLEKLLRELA
jgi:hypothetical protein